MCKNIVLGTCECGRTGRVREPSPGAQPGGGEGGRRGSVHANAESVPRVPLASPVSLPSCPAAKGRGHPSTIAQPLISSSQLSATHHITGHRQPIPVGLKSSAELSQPHSTVPPALEANAKPKAQGGPAGVRRETPAPRRSAWGRAAGRGRMT